MSKKIAVLRFSFGDQDFIAENTPEGWASFYESIGIGSDTTKVTVTVERWAHKKFSELPEWGS